MSTTKLNNIIRTVLSEQLYGRIEMSIAKQLDSSDQQKIKTNIIDPLNISTANVNTFNNFGSIKIILNRIGGRTDNSAGDKTFDFTTEELKGNIIKQLESLRGAYAPMKTLDYVWIITSDLNQKKKFIGKSKDQKKKFIGKTKEERVAVKYEVIATYIKTSILKKTLSKNTSGFYNQLNTGALVFNLAEIEYSQWQLVTGKSTQEKEISSLIETWLTAKFGQDRPMVKTIRSYFEETVDLTSTKFDCRVKGLIQQFQKEQNLTMTGDYDESTMNKVHQLNKPTYRLGDMGAVAQLTARCKQDQGEIETTNKTDADIVLPDSGVFEYLETQNDPEFYKVQKLMLSYFEAVYESPDMKKRIDDAGKLSIYTSLKNALNVQDNQGDYGDATKDMVRFLNLGFKITTPDTQVNSKFVQKLKL